jgi:hypothetical protein
MKIQSTAVKEIAKGFRVELFLADGEGTDQKTQDGIGIVVHLTMEDRYPRLADLQQAALQSARNAITGEIQRLEVARSAPGTATPAGSS